MKDLKEKYTKVLETKSNALDLIAVKEKEINKLKSSIPFEIKEGEEIMCVLFECYSDSNIHHQFLCSSKQIFKTLENKLYEKIDTKYKSTNNYFYCNTNQIDKEKSLEENKIKNGSVIMMFVND